MNAIQVIRASYSPAFYCSEAMSTYPGYSTPGAAGFDLRAWLEEPLEISPGEVKMVSSGLRMKLPVGTMLALAPRSGKGVEGLVLANLVGIIDSDYEGVVQLALWNRNVAGTPPITIYPLDRIAQAIVVPVIQAQFHHVVEFSGDPSVRGTGGFGSTGST